MFLVSAQVHSLDWPDGPTTLDELFLWPSFNATCLMNHPDVGERVTANIKNLMNYDIYINDAYSGTGSGATTLHMQHNHLKSI